MNTLLQKLNSIKNKNLFWILAISETIHNVEEAIWLPGSMPAIDVISIRAFEFRFAVIIITLFIYWVIYYFLKNENNLACYLMGGTLFIILVNVFIPHLIATIALGEYFPGVLSGVVLNIPVSSYLLWRGFKEGIFSLKSIAIGSLAFALISLLILLLSFNLEEFFSA